jgi:uncharacterized protein (DUF1499 family)
VSPRSAAATIALYLGCVSVGALAVGIASIHLDLLSPLTGFEIAAYGALLSGLLAALSGLVGLLRTRASVGLAGRSRAWAGLALGAAGLLALLGPTLAAGRVPPIHDVTTNPDDAPAFSDAVRDAEGRQNGVAYPDGGDEVPGLQRAAFPDLAPIQVATAPDETFRRARQVAQLLGWTITRADPAAGAIEAYDVTRVFRFVDDVVIRIRPAAAGSVVDLRSNSRVGLGDLGANAVRIRAFRDELTAAAP